MEKIAVNKILKITIEDFSESGYYSYRKGLFKFFKWWIGKEGIYDYHLRFYSTIENFNDVGFVIKDKKVYILPYVRVQFVNGHSIEVSFEDYESAIKYVENIEAIADNKFLTIE